MCRLKSSLRWLKENVNFQEAQQPVNNLTYPAFQHPLAPPYPYPYKFIFSQSDKCKGRNPFLVMLVLSEVRDIQTRMAIRETWGNESLYDVDVVRIFLLGTINMAMDRLHVMLEEENAMYSDLVQQDLMDTYNNLTLKTLMGLEWVMKFCPTASYLMKIDSDMFFNVDYLVHNFLHPELVRTNFFTGAILYGTGPMRWEGYQYVPVEGYPHDTYPPFCTGPGYLLSADLAKKKFDIAQVIRVIPVEDAFMGICMYELNISLTEPPPGLFNGYWEDYHHCRFHRLITVHHYGADKLVVLELLVAKTMISARVKKKQWILLASILIFGYGYLSYSEKLDSGLKWLLEKFNFVENYQVQLPPYPYPYKFLASPENKCKGRNPFLVIMVFTEVFDFQSRNVIRATWGNVRLYDVEIVRIFLLGISNHASHRYQRFLWNEIETYGDIVQQDFLDTYRNLTLKTLMGLEWVIAFCPHASYIMKIDSDMFLNVDYLVHKLLHPELPVHTNFFTGDILVGTGPVRDKYYKGYISEKVYPNDTYPPYCTGPGYVFSADLAKKIFDIAQVIQVIAIEDAFMGICLNELNISLTEPPPGSFIGLWMDYDRCRFHNLITVHHYVHYELLKIWDDFWENKTTGCDERKEKANTLIWEVTQ
ncbi:LOW QUALITY PROTEIN: uncharacterized protein PAF06_009940 [Gastrophryne carolinensis]